MMATLEEACHAFESWRASRVKKSPIPDNLWSMVVALLPHYKKSKITAALKMSGAQLVLGCQKYQQQHHATHHGFATGCFEQQSPYRIDNSVMQHQKGCELTVKGVNKSLHIHIDITQLAQVLPVVVGYL